MDARRDYEYEALRRLYKDCSPILFQLSELAASAFDRIKGLAKTAAEGKLDDANESWLTGSKYRYYLSSTEYRILAPLACFRLLKDKLTHSDMSLEPEIQIFYVVARQATRVLSEDFSLAKDFSSKLPYEPNLSENNPYSIKNPEIERQQGVPRGIVDSAIEAMLERNVDGSYQVISFYQYEKIRENPESDQSKSFNRLRYFLANFHPKQRPITWRILLTEALIFRALTQLSTPRSGNQEFPTTEELFAYTADDIVTFDWRDKNMLNLDGRAEESLKVAHEYIKTNLFPHVERALRMAKARNANRQKSP